MEDENGTLPQQTSEPVVEPIDLIDAYTIGTWTEYIRLARPEDLVVLPSGEVSDQKGKGYILWTLYLIQDFLKRKGLEHIIQYSELDELISYLHQKYASELESTPRNIDENDLRALRRTVEIIITLLQQELSKRKTIEIEVHKGILDYENLLSTGLQPLFSYPEIVVNHIPEIVSHDLLESFKALLFDLPTASVMISLRAVEAAIRDLYFKLTNEDVNEVDSYPTWNYALSEIQKQLEYRKIRSKRLEGYLDFLREIRNSAEHPDKVFEINEAERIFVESIHAIEEVYLLIEKIQAKTSRD
ncbi:hypothetical protein A3L10_03620 [Thermococcus radiotolerans]|uniref:Uncharacterized protein n=2 Tax=Thermococcus radiotolerans TaxID=187880 RepID=A0A2Z2MXU6_9EURY|nr:hypothetical protein A3L10_03620 [Thermococcus radiotolerans]